MHLRQYIRRLLYGNKEPYLSLRRMLGFFPNDLSLYKQAFTHRSSTGELENGRRINNERLEFLGDAILDAVVADIIFKQYPNSKEGFMTNTRSKIVQRESLNRIALAMGLDKMMITSSRFNVHNSYIFGNAFEALIGAIYLDQGYRKCSVFVKEQIFDKYIQLDKLANKEVNFKSILIEWSQKNKLAISFELVETFVRSDGSPIFQTRVLLMDKPLGVGTGNTKKESHQAAAKVAIRKIRRDKEVQRLISCLKQQYLGDKGSNIIPESFKEFDDFD